MVGRSSLEAARHGAVGVSAPCDNDPVKFRRSNLEALGELVVGNVGRDDPANEDEARNFPYRSSMYITEFFRELDTEHQHDGGLMHG